MQDAVLRGLAYALEPRLAPHYERHLVEECHYRTHAVLAAELALLEPSGGVFIDVGAGSGLVGKAIGELGLRVELVAVDLSPAMLELIDHHVYIAKHVADCTEALPFGEARFHGVLAAGLLEHIVEPSHFFREVARVVRPGGHFLFSFQPNHAGRTEMFDVEQGLVSHDAQRVDAGLAGTGMKVAKNLDYFAYINGSRGAALQRLVIARRD